MGRSKLSIQYTDLYDYDWSLDGTMTRLNKNRRFQTGVDNNIDSTRSSLSISNPNQIRDDQDNRLKLYKTMHEEK